MVCSRSWVSGTHSAPHRSTRPHRKGTAARSRKGLAAGRRLAPPSGGTGRWDRSGCGVVIGESDRRLSEPPRFLAPRPAHASSKLSHWKGASFPFFFSGRGAERSNSFRPARPTRAHPGLDRQWPPERLPARVVVRLRLDEGDRERRQAVCQPHVACSIPQHFSPPQAVSPCRSWHRSSSERRRFLIPGLQDGSTPLLVSRLVSSRIPSSLSDPPSSRATSSTR